MAIETTTEVRVAKAGKASERESAETEPRLSEHLSPRLRGLLLEPDPDRGDRIARECRRRLRREGPHGLREILSGRLERMGWAFYPVFNAERDRWELGIR